MNPPLCEQCGKPAPAIDVQDLDAIEDRQLAARLAKHWTCARCLGLEPALGATSPEAARAARGFMRALFTPLVPFVDRDPTPIVQTVATEPARAQREAACAARGHGERIWHMFSSFGSWMQCSDCGADLGKCDQTTGLLAVLPEAERKELVASLEAVGWHDCKACGYCQPLREWPSGAPCPACGGDP